MTPKLYDTIEFGIDDKGAGPSLELGALIEFLRQDTLDGQTIEQGSALELAERVAALERANTQLVHGCERAMSDFRTTKAYAEETESQLRKRVAELETKAAEVATKAAEVVAELRRREESEWYADEHAQGAYRESADLITEKLGLK
ncbi:MAG: hypothetical protein IPO08_20550 [Xanthomonadales bacterium]|nr:hypothetical protein [Xanthomonadales bacterium]